MRRAMAGLALMTIALTAQAFAPRTGHWWNPAESGRGFNIDIQENTLVVTFYSYREDGAVQWYLASGPMTNDRHNFSEALQRFVNGQCLACAYAGQPSLAGDDGTMSIAFASETSALVTLPGGRTTTIQPLNFGYGDPPQGLLGEWVYVEDIIISFADRFDFTIVAPGTVNDTGIAYDPVKNAGCAWQKSGPYAGLVWCLDLDSYGAVSNEYRYRFGLDETYGGVWVSQTSGNLYAMKGFKTGSTGGSSRKAAHATVDDPQAGLKAAYDAATGLHGGGGLAQSARAAFAEAIRRAASIK